MLREVKLAVAEDLVKMAAGEELDDGEAQDVKFFLICCKVKDNTGQAMKVEKHFEKVCTVLVLGADQEFKTELKVQLTTTLKSLDYYDSLLEGEGGADVDPILVCIANVGDGDMHTFAEDTNLGAIVQSAPEIAGEGSGLADAFLKKYASLAKVKYGGSAPSAYKDLDMADTKECCRFSCALA